MGNNNLSILICLAVSYLAGCANPAFMISKARGFDIRSKGSGNAGASNAAMTLGKKEGIFCALFDFFKAYFTVKVTARCFPLIKSLRILAGSACILGHIFPFMMHFKGGKGLACLGGVILAYDFRIFAVILPFEMLTVLLSAYLCTAAVSASVIFAVIMLVKDGLMYALFFMPVIAAIWKRHTVNFRRIRYGVEVKIRYLWNRREEEERVRTNWESLSESERLYVELPELG